MCVEHANTMGIQSGGKIINTERKGKNNGGG